MKKIIFILIASMALGSCCITGECMDSIFTYIYVNESGVDIMVDGPYNKEANIFRDELQPETLSFKIKNGEKYKMSMVETSNPFPFDTSYDTDIPIKIIFDNSVVVSYHYRYWDDPDTRNPWNPDDYKVRKVQRKHSKCFIWESMYIITAEDYQNALEQQEINSDRVPACRDSILNGL